jgi:hypothetical protein
MARSGLMCKAACARQSDIPKYGARDWARRSDDADACFRRQPNAKLPFVDQHWGMNHHSLRRAAVTSSSHARLARGSAPGCRRRCTWLLPGRRPTAGGGRRRGCRCMDQPRALRATVIVASPWQPTGSPTRPHAGGLVSLGKPSAQRPATRRGPTWSKRGPDRLPLAAR